MFIYDYRYYIEGRYLAILQRALDSVYDPYLTLDDDLFLTPQNADTDAILIRHTVHVAAPTDATTDMGISYELAQAVVHYVKAKFAEDVDKRMYNWHMNKFYEMVEAHNTNLNGPKRAMPNYLGAMR